MAGVLDFSENPGLTIRQYTPHEGQERTHLSKNRKKIVTSANRWGKTLLGLAECLWWARGEHPYRSAEARRKPAKQIWICVPSYETFDRVHLPIFEQLCPNSWYRPGSNQSPGGFNKSDNYVDILWAPRDDVKLADEDDEDEKASQGYCRIWVMTYEQNVKNWVGAALDGAWMDEPPSRQHMKELIARLVSKKGWLLTTFTPVDGVGWWYESIWKEAKAGKNGWFFEQAALAERDELNENPEEYEVGRVLVPQMRIPFRGMDEDGNRCTCPSEKEHGSCPGCRHLVIEFAKGYPDITDREIRIFGEVKGKSGLIYKQFDEAVHLVEPFKLPRHFTLFGGIDPGYHGFAVVLMAATPKKQAFVVGEVYSQGELTNRRARRIADLVRSLRPKPSDWPDGEAIVPIVVDTEDKQVVMELNARALEAAERDANNAEELIVYLSFSSIDQGLKAVKAGILRTQQMLAQDKERKRPIQVTRDTPDGGEPRIYVFNDLHSEWQGTERYYRQSRFLWEIGLYGWAEPPRTSEVRPDKPNDDTADGAHMMDAFRYAVMSRFGPTYEAQLQAKYEEDFRDDSELDVDERREKSRIQRFLMRLDQQRREEDEWEGSDEYQDWNEYDELEEWAWE